MINSLNIVFVSFLATFIFSFIFNNSFDLFDEIYGHGISRDESLPFDVSGKQIAIEGILEPPYFNEDNNQNPTFTLRAHDEKNNETIKDVNYRVIAKLKNETILDQRFHAIDGVVSANLIPSNNSLVHQILTKNQEAQQGQGQQNFSKNDLIPVSLEDPITIKSKMFSDGGLYVISVILEKSNKGIKLEYDKKIDLFISIAKDFPFVIKEESSNDTTKNDGNLTFIVRTYYDEIVDFDYDQKNSIVSFKMPFTWDVDYINQVVYIHQEVIIPKSHIPLSNVSAFTAALYGKKVPDIAVNIDDYSDENNRSVHFIVSNSQLIETANQLIKAGINPYAEFKLQPIIK